jgi:hypothetical protein
VKVSRALTNDTQDAARMSAPRTGKRSRKRARSKSNEVDGPSRPIVFLSPGLKPDVFLTLFHQEFHVHSVILKLYSNYFRKFLNSPDGFTNIPESTPFKHHYISEIDEDGTWALVPATNVRL